MERHAFLVGGILTYNQKRWQVSNFCQQRIFFSNPPSFFYILESNHRKVVFCCYNCLSLPWEKFFQVWVTCFPSSWEQEYFVEKRLCKFEAVGQEFAKNLRSLEQFIHTVKGQINFWKQNAFLTYSWIFVTSNKLEQLEFKLEKINGI